jgi:hypothetical protein
LERNTPAWKTSFWRFLTLVGISNIIYIFNFLLLVESNFLQISIVVLVRIFGYFAMHQLNFVQNDFKAYQQVDLVE